MNAPTIVQRKILMHPPHLSECARIREKVEQAQRNRQRKLSQRRWEYWWNVEHHWVRKEMSIRGAWQYGIAYDFETHVFQ